LTQVSNLEEVLWIELVFVSLTDLDSVMMVFLFSSIYVPSFSITTVTLLTFIIYARSASVSNYLLKLLFNFSHIYAVFAPLDGRFSHAHF